ncbi:hypothetical protein [Sulfurovum mangrovi]|uniref:hypothetical protein n=1 Tax=Sulfurovum mangrovi TaxID=2893889 RepID=UPI001E4E45C3|nr:hypothetical protein [Sulfurovum mangrovi]UFH59837.1 hypothetical protein LN246_03090 [Sulfurovum mangrovi]UFH59888.1 hypothetical protein LN246_03350 [Sulfurovum mangrovi]
MSMVTKNDLFGDGLLEKEITVKAWGNKKVVIRELTNEEFSDAQECLVGEAATADDMKDGKVRVSIKNVEASKNAMVSKALVEPALTVEDIRKLPSIKTKGINEIYDAVMRMNAPKK